MTGKDDESAPFTITDVRNVDTYTHAAFVHGEDPKVITKSVISRTCPCRMGPHDRGAEGRLPFTDEAKAVLSAASILTD